MWTIRTFKTKESMLKFIVKYAGRIQFNEIFINNMWGIEYRMLRRVY